MIRRSGSALTRTLVSSLNFAEDRTQLLRDLTPAEWQALLAITDRARFTLALADRCGDVMPPEIRQGIDQCAARNADRYTRIVGAHAEISAAMRSRGAEFLVLKGLTHAHGWNAGSGRRPQYDIDLYCPPAHLPAALEAAVSLGYEPIALGGNPTDHLPVMIRKTGWRWRGDYYDANQPLALELHHRFWNPALGFAVCGEDRFWDRQTSVVSRGIALPALHPVDRLTYAAWHGLRHLLRGNLQPGHALEIAHFLHYSAADDVFWAEWKSRGTPAGRLAESIALRLAKEWYGCRMHPVTNEYTQALPPRVERWFRLFAFSALHNGGTDDGQLNKDELFLNLCLARNKRECGRIAARRLFPVRMAARIPDAHTCEGAAKNSVSVIASRALHHLRALAPVIRSGVRWWLTGRWVRWTPSNGQKNDHP